MPASRRSAPRPSAAPCWRPVRNADSRLGRGSASALGNRCRCAPRLWPGHCSRPATCKAHQRVFQRVRAFRVAPSEYTVQSKRMFPQSVLWWLNHNGRVATGISAIATAFNVMVSRRLARRPVGTRAEGPVSGVAAGLDRSWRVPILSIRRWLRAHPPLQRRRSGGHGPRITVPSVSKAVRSS
jgi:hypothetical protein